MWTAEDVMAAQKAGASKWFGLAQSAWTHTETLVALNMRTSKMAMRASSRYAQAMLEVKTAQDSLQLHAGLVQPVIDQGKAYGQEVQATVLAFQTECTQWLQTLSTDAQKQFQASMNSGMEHIPASGDAAAMAVMKNWVATGMAAVEAMQKAAQQATQMVQTQVEELTKPSNAA